MSPIFTNNVFYYTTPIQLELDVGVPKEKIVNSDGCTCKKCQEYYPYANLPEEGLDFVCWACRHGY
jgi:formylmethanofuran dehydrogenase subunit E